ncbi:MAG: FKBP-type peptidyl-prolyl cis-trans isomerase [Urechidicola sp.]|jgi:FKBP-type peptidyl-prolyl cis-trans isomerase
MNFKRVGLTTIGLFFTMTAIGATTINTDKDKLSYSLGMMISEQVLKQYGEVDYQILLEGMKAQAEGKETLMTIEEAGEALNELQQKMNDAKFGDTKANGAAYLAENGKKDGVTTTDTGLQYTVMTEGDGAKPAATDTVTVHYRGTLLDGTEFDSSYSRNQPTSFGLNQVIPGWTEGVQLMNIGSKYKFVVPYELAYGERGAGQSIGPYETLIFEVELLEIK